MKSPDVEDDLGRGGVGSAARAVCWFLLIAWAVYCCGAYALAASRAASVLQQAASAADACAWLLAGYVVCRAVDALTRG